MADPLGRDDQIVAVFSLEAEGALVDEHVDLKEKPVGKGVPVAAPSQISLSGGQGSGQVGQPGRVSEKVRGSMGPDPGIGDQEED